MNLINKITKFTLYALLGISVLFGVLFYLGSISEGPLIYLMYALFGITAVIAIGFPVVYMILNPKTAKNTLIGLAFLAVVVLVSYLLASDKVMTIVGYTGTDNNPETLKQVGTGLYTTYILFGLAFLTILYTEISSSFK